MLRMNTHVYLNILLVVTQARKQNRIKHVDQLCTVKSEQHENRLRDKHSDSGAAHHSHKRHTETSPYHRQRKIK